MGNENTAIVDLLAGLNRKPLADDPTDDVLFAGSRRDPLAGPGRSARGTEPPPNLFAMPAPPPAPAPLPAPHLLVSLPKPFMNMPSAGVDQHLSTVRVARTQVTAPNKKLYALVGVLGIVAAILAGIYVGGGDDAKATQVAASAAPSQHVPMPAAAPAVTPIEPAAQAAVPTVTPTVTPIEPAPAAAPTVPAPGETVAPAEVVPASAFVASAETTLPTVASADEAPAAAAEEPAAVAPAKKVKKSRRELARERRAAKRASKRGAKRERRQVAAAARSKADKVDTKLNGNGALSISSKQPREVWVDGRNSKRMTPLRVLLKPGKHKVTLFDKSKGTAKTFEVEIKPNVTTKVAK